MTSVTKKKRQYISWKYIKHERRQVYILTCIVIWSVLICGVCKQFVLGSVTIQGNSMNPTLVSGDWHIFHRWAFYFQNPERGEIVVLNDPNDQVTEIKRVVGLPHDTIQIKDGEVYVNDHKLIEPYLDENTFTPSGRIGTKKYRIGDNHYFVLGDNRLGSYDSRDLGAIDKRFILGKVNHATENDLTVESSESNPLFGGMNED